VDAVVNKEQEERMARAQVMCLHSHPQARVRLVCFSHAGATEAAFACWPDILAGDIEVGTVRKPPLADYRHLTEVLAEAVLVYVSQPPRIPCALFGQSLGGLLAFGVARLLRQRQAEQPCCLLCASATAPQVPVTIWPGPPPECWTITELAAYLRHTGGTAETVLSNATYLRRLLPRMQVDLAVCASYTYTQEPPLSSSLAVFGGLHDAGSSTADLAAWAEQTSAHFSLYRFPGGHFFLHERETQRPFLQTLSCEVMRWLEDASAAQVIPLPQRRR
jgi:medium-chain acyl-[acyl-carrier-protein] hydrolase